MKNLNIYIIMVVYFVLTFFLEKILGNRVMTSLRDSEDQVKISLD